MRNYDYAFQNLTKQQIESALGRAIEAALHHKYGSQPDEIIACRIRQEWVAMKERDSILDVAVLYELSKWLKAHNRPYWVGSCAGASFLLYLLDITCANPLPPHLCCPVCHSVIWKDDEKDGFDIPPIPCKNDGTALTADGHYLPWQCFWGYDEHEAEWIVYLAKDAQAVISDFFDGHWILAFVAEEKKKALPFVLSKLRFGYGFHKAAEFRKTEVNADCKDAVIQLVCGQLQKQKGYIRKGIPAPTSFADAVAVMGLLDRVCGSWNYQLPALLRQGHTASDLNVFQEDVFFDSQKLCDTEREAWYRMVEYNKHLGVLALMEEIQADREVCVPGQWSPGIYRAFRADLLERLFFLLKTGEI